MEYVLRQIETGNPDPLIIKLNSDDMIVGKDTYPALSNYPNVLPQHTQFLRHFGKWFVKSMQSSEKIHVNGFPLVTHRLKEIQIGDHIAFGSADNQKRFVCCLSVKENSKSTEVEVIDLSIDDDPGLLSGSFDIDRTIKKEFSSNIIPISESSQVEDLGAGNDHLVKHSSHSVKQSDHTSGSLFCKKNEPMDWHADDNSSPSTVQVNDPLCSVNRDPVKRNIKTVKTDPLNELSQVFKNHQMDRSFPATVGDNDYICPSTVQSEPIFHSPPSEDNDTMDKLYPEIENQLDHICPSPAQIEFMDDYVPSQKIPHLDNSAPIIKKDLQHNSFNIKSEHTDTPVMENKPMYSNPPLIKTEPVDTNLHAIKREPIDANPEVIKRKDLDPTLPIIKSEPMDTSDRFSNTEPANDMPPSVSNELLSNISIKSEPMDNCNASSNVLPSFSPAKLNSDVLKQVATSSAKELEITSKQLQPASSSNSAISNSDFSKKSSALMSKITNVSSVTIDNSISNLDDFSSTVPSQNILKNATSIQSKSHDTNSGYSEIEDVITISDDEAYLDYASCKTIKQEYPDDDFNRNSGFNNAEALNKTDLNLLSFGDESTLSSINESIKEHEESAKKLLDEDSIPKISPEISNFLASLSKNISDVDSDQASSNSSISEHEHIIIPFAKKKQTDIPDIESKTIKNNIEIPPSSSKTEKQRTESTKQPSSTSKKQPPKRTLFTEPKQMSQFAKKFHRQEHKKDTKQVNKEIPKKTKNGSVLSNQKAVAKLKSNSGQRALASPIKDKSALSKKLLSIKNKNPKVCKRSSPKPSKLTNGVVLTKKISFKIPKKTTSDLKSNSTPTGYKSADQTEGSSIPKKTPSIARKPDKWASRSGFLITDLNAVKQKPAKETSALSKTIMKTDNLNQSNKINVTADREKIKTGKETVSELKYPNVTGVRSSKMSSPDDINDKIRTESGSKISSFPDTEIHETRTKIFAQPTFSNAIDNKSSKISSSVGSKFNNIGRETGSQMSSTADKEMNKFVKESVSTLNSPKNVTGIGTSPIPVIVSAKRRKDRKSLSDDWKLPKTPTKVNRSSSCNQVSPGLMSKQFSGEMSFESDKDKSCTSRGFESNALPNKEKKVAEFPFPANTSEASKSTEWQQSYEDQVNFKSGSMRTFNTNKTLPTSKSEIQSNKDQILIPKQQLLVSANIINNLQRNNTLVITRNLPEEIMKISKTVLNIKNFIIKMIVEWKELWFKEYEDVRKPHEDLTNGVLLIPLYFNSLDHYISSFIPMLLLEIWEALYIEYKPVWKDKKQVVNKFYFIVTGTEHKRDVSEYHCEALINHLAFEPKAESLAIMSIQDNITGNIFPIFGYIVKSYKVQSYHNTNPELLNFNPAWTKDAKLYRFLVQVKIRPNLSPILNKIMKGNGLCFISNYLKLLEAAQELENSPFCQSILKPDSFNFFTNYPEVPSTSSFNKTQMSVIEGITLEIEKQASEPKLFLIHGGPGTGKTHTILGLTENLIFSSHSKQKILIVAPSSVAIDEVGSRLIDLDERSKSWRSRGGIRFVRINFEGKTSEKMKPYSLEEMYASYKIKSKFERLESINMQIHGLIKSNDPSDQADLRSLMEKQKNLRSDIEFIQTDNKTRSDYYHYLLQESQVILTTLNCCSSPLLQEFCKQNSNQIFSCCIIDEVTQCTELELLQVISLGINKLILVGDRHGLPPVVLSKTAEQFFFARSSFERFLQFFSQTQQESPVIELSEQYRMHSDICYFPSCYFYNNQLSIADGIDSRYEHFLAVTAQKTLAPYTVFYIQNGGNKKLCADTVIKLCIQSVMFKPNFSVGIIVSTTELKELFSTWIKVLRKSNSNYEVVEVDTVENFQGQEKDVIFLCCYHNDESDYYLSGRKLNVALTRARQCLVLCIFSPTLRLDEDWLNLTKDAQDRHCFQIIKKTKKMSLILK